MRSVQLSDIHTGTSLFRPKLPEAAIDETNAFAPDLVAEDLTTEGRLSEFEEAKAYVDQLEFFPPHDTDVDGDRWIGVLEELERLDPRVVVPGHGESGDAGVVAAVREYLTMLRDETGRLAGEGKDADAIVSALEPRMRALHPDWDSPEWIPFGVRSFLAE